MENGDIWVAATDSNPSVLIEHWRLGSAAKEDCCCICAFDGRWEEEGKYSFLFGGTGNGQIIVYTKYGTVGRRFQIHSTQVIKIVSDQRESMIMSLSVGT
jgi:hypothetical protein